MLNFDPDLAAARADLCRFLSACYYEPCAEFAEEHLFDSMLACATRLSPGMAAQAKRLGDAFAATDLQTLLVDYTRLFLGPAQPLATPYGSCWLTADATPEQDATAALLVRYHEGGFVIDDDFHDLPDHVAVELEFLYLLLFKQHQAASSGNAADAADAAALAATAQHFLRDHLGAWVSPFTVAVAAGAQTAFYRELGTLTFDFVQMSQA